MSASASVDAECPSSLRHVEEAGELEALVQRVVASGGQDAGTAFPRFAAIVSRCLEWSVVGVADQLVTPLIQLHEARLPCQLMPCHQHLTTGWLQDASSVVEPVQSPVRPLPALGRSASTRSSRSFWTRC